LGIDNLGTPSFIIQSALFISDILNNIKLYPTDDSLKLFSGAVFTTNTGLIIRNGSIYLTGTNYNDYNDPNLYVTIIGSKPISVELANSIT
jgi:hypothetical protein